ncbi:MAG TPA: hypothetical protein DEH22_06405 [Chloroflexi bacterium]|nr:hypothetical protein [Chloroflexota bacterium]
MHPIFEDYLHRLTDLHAEILSAIESLPPEALDWTPLRETSGDLNSISVLVTHLCGAERYWIGDVACGDPSGRVRADEFEVQGLSTEVLAHKIETATAYACAALENLSLAELEVEKSRLRNGRAVSAGWALLHALEHTAIHLGHIQITRQLWNEHKN